MATSPGNGAGLGAPWAIAHAVRRERVTLGCGTGERALHLRIEGGVEAPVQVTVKLCGVLAPEDRRNLGRSFDLELRDDVTAGELLRDLAARCGATFRQALESPDSRLPRHIRMFANGEMLVSRDQTLNSARGPDAGVTVVLLAPMMGG